MNKMNQIKKLLDLIEQSEPQRGEFDELLDELVHNLVSREASDINNGGHESQVRYLVEALGAERAEAEIATAIEERKGCRP